MTYPTRPPLVPERVRAIHRGFAFIPTRFLHHGFLASLRRHEFALYLFLVLAADRHGLSFYGHDRICTTLGLILDDYIEARNQLISKDLIAFDGTTFQVLSLPQSPRPIQRPLLETREDFEQNDPATIRKAMQDALRIS